MKKYSGLTMIANVEVFVQQSSDGIRGSLVNSPIHLISQSEQCKHEGSFSRASLTKSHRGPIGALSVGVIVLRRGLVPPHRQLGCVHRDLEGLIDLHQLSRAHILH